MRANLPPSLEDLAKQRRDANAADAAKPTFLTKEQRAAAAMKRREEEVAAQRAKMEDARELHQARGGGERARESRYGERRRSWRRTDAVRAR